MPRLLISYGRDCLSPIDLLRSFDLDLLRGFLSLKLLGKGQREYAFLETRFDFVRVNAFRHLEAALEGAKVALTHIIILLLLLFFFLFLALDDQVAIGNLHFDVLLIHPGQFGYELIGLLAFGSISNIERRVGSCQKPRPKSSNRRSISLRRLTKGAHACVVDGTSAALS